MFTDSCVETTKDADFVEIIRKLSELRDERILTQEEFEDKEKQHSKKLWIE